MLQSTAPFLFLESSVLFFLLHLSAEWLESPKQTLHENVYCRIYVTRSTMGTPKLRAGAEQNKPKPRLFKNTVWFHMLLRFYSRF